MLPKYGPEMPEPTLCGKARSVNTERASEVACVVIGRNEGERLVRCLRSVRAAFSRIVYVDSGSSDDSVANARAAGARVVALDLSIPFTAARARNAGFDALAADHPELDYVFFVDGDCEVFAPFIPKAVAVLEQQPDVAVVCGRRRERAPERSVYNRLCDIEWDTPVGEADACGGDALMRVSAFREVSGYDAAIVAGEEPDLCVRLRGRGHRVLRIDEDMTLHDAAITRFSAWWTRAKRAGHAFAEGAHRHGATPSRHFVRETRRAIFFGVALPAVAFAAVPFTLGTSLGLLAAYPVSAARAYRYVRGRGRTPEESLAYAAFTTLGKLPEATGVLTFHARRLRGMRPTLIEYQRAGSRA